MTTDTIFQELRAAREAKGLTIGDISKQTLINERFLEALERGDTTILPAAYVRAFLRAFATSVDLDPAYVMRRYEGGKPGVPAATPPPAAELAATSAPESSVEQKTQPPFWSHSWVRSVGTTLVVLGGIGIIAYFARQSGDEQPQEIPFGTMVQENTARLSPPDTTRGTVLPQAFSTRDSLVLRGNTIDSVWVQISVDALPPTEHLFPPTSGRTWKARDRFMITLGNAGGISFRLNGRDLGTFGKRGAVLRDIEITRENLKSPVQIEQQP
ncbi:MAG: DUF4115 domain-containing protein [Bacteroidetes bacterium]|nr:DUF4115 domain-containing protein [Bacteroidota bacterium]